MTLLRKAAEGSIEGDPPDYWYGVIEPYGGTLWPVLHYTQYAAREAAKKMGGEVVLVAVRVLEDEDGEAWPLPDYGSKAGEEAASLKDSEEAVEDARKTFEDALRPMSRRSTIAQGGAR